MSSFNYVEFPILYWNWKALKALQMMYRAIISAKTLYNSPSAHPLKLPACPGSSVAPRSIPGAMILCFSFSFF